MMDRLSFGHTQCDTDPILAKEVWDSDTGIGKVSGSDQQSVVCGRSYKVSGGK